MSSAHVFSEVINVKNPNKDARRDVTISSSNLYCCSRVLTCFVRVDPEEDSRKTIGFSFGYPESPINFTALAAQTEGYSTTDLQDYVARAVHRAAIRSGEDGVMNPLSCFPPLVLFSSPCN